MPHAVGVLYPTPTGTGTLRALSSTASTATSASKVSIPALTLVGTNYTWSPEATASNNVADGSRGWQLAPLVPLGDGGKLLAGSLTVTLSITWSQTAASVTSPPAAGVYLFVGTTQIAQASATVTGAAGTETASLTLSWSDTTIPAGAALIMVPGVYATNASPTTATTATLNYGAAGTKLGAGANYTILATRSATETLTCAEAVTRRYTGSRAVTETIPTTETAAARTTYTRAVTEQLASGTTKVIRPIYLFDD